MSKLFVQVYSCQTSIYMPWNPKECKSKSLWVTNLAVMPATAFLRRLLSNVRKELAWKLWNMEILGLKKELNRGGKSLRNCRRPLNTDAKNLCFTHKIFSRHGFLQGSVSKKVSLDLMQTQVRCCTHAHTAVRLEITAWFLIKDDR